MTTRILTLDDENLSFAQDEVVSWDSVLEAYVSRPLSDLLTSSDVLGALSADALAGWLPISHAWTYASATTITVPSGAAARYAKGDKIRLVQTTTKYFYVVAVADTLLTVTGGSDYSVANAAISDIFVSKASSPVGFPGWFNYTPVFTGFSADPGSVVARFFIDGSRCHTSVNMGSSGTSNSTAFTVTAPVAAATVSGAFWGGPQWRTVDNGANKTTPGSLSIASAASVFTLESDAAGGAWTAANGKRSNFQIDYQF